MQVRDHSMSRRCTTTTTNLSRKVLSPSCMTEASIQLGGILPSIESVSSQGLSGECASSARCGLNCSFV